MIGRKPNTEIRPKLLSFDHMYNGNVSESTVIRIMAYAFSRDEIIKKRKALRKYFKELRDKENKINNEQDRANDEDIEKIVQLLLRKKEEIGAVLRIQLDLFNENDEKDVREKLNEYIIKRKKDGKIGSENKTKIEKEYDDNFRNYEIENKS
ncbi:7560_t:CDS:2 [Rhizophagus irregularis]|nr:7560_t:CDS:2 [Rhizophagus irregularis]